MMNSELTSILEKMDIPIQRKSALNKSNLEWLQKNLGKRNRDHSKYSTVLNEVQRRIQNKEYYN